MMDAMVRALSGLELATDRLRRGVGSGTIHHNARIAPYDGYGTARTATVFGRVLRSAPPPRARADAGIWENFLATYRRFGTHEIPRARVRVRIGEAEREVIANEEGLFACHLDIGVPLPAGHPWHEVDYSLVSDTGQSATARGRVYVPAPTATFGVISDIDDTIVRTDVGRWLRMVRTTIFGNALTRLPFQGVASLYNALATGGGDSGPNPFFYVSSSPWNLRELLAEFFEVRGIPPGPILLSDWGTDIAGSQAERRREHKLRTARDILATHPELPFILIGDSGQEDPEIYAALVREHPERILAVYIRDVNVGARRRAAIQELATYCGQDGCELILATDTMDIARHAASHGWIPPGQLSRIEETMGE